MLMFFLVLIVQWVHLVFLTTERCSLRRAVVPGFPGGTTEAYVSNISNDLDFGRKNRTRNHWIGRAVISKAPGGPPKRMLMFFLCLYLVFLYSSIP